MKALHAIATFSALFIIPCAQADLASLPGFYRGHTEFSWNDCAAEISLAKNELTVRIYTQNDGEDATVSKVDALQLTLKSGELIGVRYDTPLLGLNGQSMGSRDTRLVLSSGALTDARIDLTTTTGSWTQSSHVACLELAKQ